MSLLNRISSADITEFLAAIALEKTVLRGVQSFADSFAVAPSVQLALEQQQSSSSSSSSSSLHFDKTDIDATTSSQLPISQDLSVVFADFQATLSEQLFESESNISSKLHKIEQHIVESASSFAPSSSSVFALRFSPFCSVFVDMSLLNRISSADITEFLAAIALEKTVLRGVQSFADSFAVAPSVQLALEQQQSSSSSSSSSSLHFDKTDIDATTSSQLPISQDLSVVFADFQATLSEQLFESESNISSKLHKIEQHVRDSLSDQAAIFKSLSQEARQEIRTLDDVHTIRFNEFRKTVLAQNASIFVGLADVRKEVDAIHAKVDIMAERLNAIQKDAEATKEAHSHQILEFHSQAQENHAVIHAQLSELVDYIHRGRADKKGEISGSRGPQQPADTQISGSAVTPSFEQRVEMAKRQIVQTVINTDAATRESQEAAERDRERRRKEAQSLKRRRRD
ncbi:hypothetical protein F511_21865 [Dorcoceras hygrometricum]|uniref:Uncharacterized protein n=1 Tax=Dorcoceras hygrometricum TaxID=472368 RepID=A0A2Z7B175_9LAMI|nr:hypothetical protein F511_21865 [Dorcoceras hygrometricum]